jgi:epoxide hydrolase 4
MSTVSQLPDVGIELREGYAEIGDQSLHYVEAGDGPLVVLLHGFPEFWFGWRLQIEPLVAAGFRVVAPDTRGYNLSSKPEGFESYGVDLLADDMTSAASSRSEAQSPRCSSVTTGAEVSPGRSR